jgi:hypothetical protein
VKEDLKMMRYLRTRLFVLAPLVAVLLAGGCSDSSNNTTEPGDTTAPAAITNLAHGTVTATSVVLTWTAPGDDGSTGTAGAYDIRYSTATITEGNWASATQAPSEPAPVAAGGAQTFTVTGLSPGTPYYFAMKAADEVPNWSALSNVVPAQTLPEEPEDTTPPAAITNLATGTATTTSIVLNWTAPGDDDATGTAGQYDVRYSTSTITEGNWASATQATGEPVPGASGSAQTFTVTGLSPDTPYHFAIKTADEVPNWSALSNDAQGTTAQTGDTTPPAAITNLATGTATTTSIVLNWTAPGDDGSVGTAGQYDIRYSTSTITEGNWASATQATGGPAPGAAGSAQTFTVTGLSPGTPYYFAIKTADEVPNWSALSNDAQGTTAQAADTTPPAAVTNLATGAVTTTTIALSWTAPGDDGSVGTASQYDIRYSTSTITEGNWASATQVTGEPVPGAAASAQTYTVTGLSPSTPYHFAIKTADEVPNWSALSNVAQGTTGQPADTTPPADITTLSAIPAGPNTVDLIWTAPGDDGSTGTASQYDVRYSKSPISNTNWASATQASGEPSPGVAGDPDQMSIDGLDPDTDYYFAIKTSDEVPNTSGLSNVPMAHTPPVQSLPPGLTVPTFPDSVCITSDDQYAQLAKMIASSQLAIVSAYASLGSAFLGPLGGADWQQAGEGCWDWDYSVLGCSYHYQACKTGTVYTYTLTINGSCYGPTFDNWVAFRAVVDEAAYTGTFYYYVENSTDIQLAWVWTWAADENSGSYTFYEGDPTSAPIQAQVTWSRSADQNVYDMTYEVPGSTKWVSHFEKNPCSGYYRSFQWDDTVPRWWMDQEIIWNADGTGSWVTYDDTGTETDRHEW